MKQVRLPADEVCKVLPNLCDMTTKWHDVLATYPSFEQQKKEDD
jgi:hypothetical protein